MKYKARLSKNKITKIIRTFCADIEAIKAALILKISRQTINQWYDIFRTEIHNHRVLNTQKMGGIVEVKDIQIELSIPKNEEVPSWFKKGSKTQSILGILSRDGIVHTQLMPLLTESRVEKVIKEYVHPDAVIITDASPLYKGLKEAGYDKHVIINRKSLFLKEKPSHTFIAAFWSMLRYKLFKLRGHCAKKFHLHLKEIEWRYKKDVDQMEKDLKKMLQWHK